VRKKLLEAMNNAMCSDFCYDLNCRGCEEARLLAMEAIVFQRVYERWEQLLPGLRALALDGLLPKSVVKEITAVTKGLQREAGL
jgi:hypothetical protein